MKSNLFTNCGKTDYIFPSIQGCPGDGSQDEARLLSDLLKKYNEMVRPAQRASKNTTVHFSLALNQIINLYDTTGHLQSSVTLRMVRIDKLQDTLYVTLQGTLLGTHQGTLPSAFQLSIKPVN